MNKEEGHARGQPFGFQLECSSSPCPCPSVRGACCVDVRRITPSKEDLYSVKASGLNVGLENVKLILGGIQSTSVGFSNSGQDLSTIRPSSCRVLATTDQITHGICQGIQGYDRFLCFLFSEVTMASRPCNRSLSTNGTGSRIVQHTMAYPWQLSVT